MGEKKDVYRSKLEAKDACFLINKSLWKRLEVKAKIRYNHPEARALLRLMSKGRISVEFNKPQWAITPGQSVVLYKNNIVVGGATIEKAL